MRILIVVLSLSVAAYLSLTAFRAYPPNVGPVYRSLPWPDPVIAYLEKGLIPLPSLAASLVGNDTITPLRTICLLSTLGAVLSGLLAIGCLVLIVTPDKRGPRRTGSRV